MTAKRLRLASSLDYRAEFDEACGRLGTGSATPPPDQIPVCSTGTLILDSGDSHRAAQYGEMQRGERKTYDSSLDWHMEQRSSPVVLCGRLKPEG